MSAAKLIVRVMFFLIILIVLGTIAVFGMQIIEPFSQAFGEPPSDLGWGNPAATTLSFAAFGFFGLIGVLIYWLVGAPIQQDKRQGFR